MPVQTVGVSPVVALGSMARKLQDLPCGHADKMWYVCLLLCWCTAPIKVRVSYRDGDAAFGQQCVETINSLIAGFSEKKVVVPLSAGVYPVADGAPLHQC